MTKYFDILIENIIKSLQEGYGRLYVTPEQIVVVNNSDAAKTLDKNPPGRFSPADGLRYAIANWGDYSRRLVWEKCQSKKYSKRIGVEMTVILKLPGENNPRALGRIDGRIFNVYWVGTHEDFNKTH